MRFGLRNNFQKSAYLHMFRISRNKLVKMRIGILCAVCKQVWGDAQSSVRVAGDKNALV
jgi:hypothetical protein